MKIAAVCVLYNPDISQVKSNLDLILEQVGELWLIDNSDSPSGMMNYYTDFSEKIHYVWLGENKGIAFALNVGCKCAQEVGYDWVLTMDQDSQLPPNCIKEYCRSIETYPSDKIGIVTCLIQLGERDRGPKKHILDQHEVDCCWTSGSLINLSAYSQTAGFNNNLFIDGVDIAYCLDIRSLDYRIIRNSHVVLMHQLGKTKSYDFGSCHLFYITNHTSIRRYYITRNYLWLSEKYGDKYPFCKITIAYFIKTISQILLFEEYRFSKLKAMVRGYKDFKRGIFGKYRI